MIYRPFKQQQEFLLDKSRIKCLFASKRSGKSEIAYIDTINKAETQEGYINNGVDPWQAAIIAPTDNMLHRLVWPKFRAFAKPFEEDFQKAQSTLQWKNNNSKIMGFSGEKIERMEGQKLNHVHMTEAFQMDQGVFLEALARVSDSKGTITIDGSLGPNIPNPKSHWLYQMFKEKPFDGARCWEWHTVDNPHFPKDELERMESSLDPRTFRQMFKIDWDVPGTSLVYDEFDEANTTRGYIYNPSLPTYISIDWGWAHDMACLFFQYDPRTDTVYLFDEIVSPRLTLEKMWERISSKNYRIFAWICDIAGNQEREQSGMSNVQFMRKKYSISFKFRQTAISYGIPIMRSYIKDGMARRKFIVDEVKCPRFLDSIKNYAYPEKNGQIVNENPVKTNSDCVDAARYMFVNMLDKNKAEIKNLDRWKMLG